MAELHADEHANHQGDDQVAEAIGAARSTETAFIQQRWTRVDAFAIYVALLDANILYWVVDSMDQDPACDDFRDLYDQGIRSLEPAA